VPNGLARDLRPDEARGLTWTTEPLREGLSIIGVPEVVLWIGASMPVATCVVRLSEVDALSGVSSLVATGVLNLTHRRSDSDPTPLVPGAPPEEIRIPLRTSGYRFSAGNRIRLTLLTSYWPVLWPSPLPGELRVSYGRPTPSRLVLPVLPSSVATLTPPAFRTPAAGLGDVGSDEEDPPEWRIEEDVLHGTVTVTIYEGETSVTEDGSRVSSSERLVLTASDPEPARARLDSDVVYRWAGDGFEVDIRATGSIRSDVEAFDIGVALDVRLDGEPFFAREWAERIPRRLV
jgi:hypothetical protein